MPWASKKPVMMVTSQWEDVNFRLHGVNFILRLCDRMVRMLHQCVEYLEILSNARKAFVVFSALVLFYCFFWWLLLSAEDEGDGCTNLFLLLFCSFNHIFTSKLYLGRVEV